MSANLSRIRRLLPFGVVPWNPDDDELAQSIPTWGPPRRGSLEVRTGELEGFAPPPLQTRRPLPIPIAQPNGEPDDNEELQQQRLPRALTRPMQQPAVIEAADTAPLLDDIGTPPVMIRRNNKRRPIGAIGGDSDLDRDTALLGAQRGYKAPHSTKDLLLRAATGFFSGGIPGAIGSALDYSLNQDTRNADAVGYDMGQTEGRLRRNQQQQATVAAQRRQGLQDRLLEARVVDVETPAVVKPDGWEVEVDTDGDGIPDTVKYEERKLGSTRPVFQRPQAPRPPMLQKVTQPDGSIVTKQSTDFGKTWTTVPDLTSIPPPKVEAGDNNEMIQQSIADAQRERDGIGEYLKTLPKTVPSEVKGVDAPNPEYTSQMNRYRELDNNIRNWRMKLKPGRARTAATGSSGKRWSAAKWAAANQGKDLTAAKAEAKRRGLVIVE